MGHGITIVEEEIPPWTVADTLALWTLISMPILTVPILYAGVALLPAAGPIAIQGIALPVITTTAKAALASCAFTATASLKFLRRGNANRPP